jgi:hypothetical protein
MRSATIHFAPITAFQTHTSPQAFPPENLTFWMFEEDGFVRQAKTKNPRTRGVEDFSVATVTTSCGEDMIVGDARVCQRQVCAIMRTS